MAFIDDQTPSIQALVDAEPVKSPGIARVFRRIPAPRTWRTPAERNVRVTEAIGPQRAPDPVRAGDTPTRPAKVQIVTFLSIAPWKAVMRDQFLIEQVAPNHLAATPYGSQLPVIERANIRRPAAEAYGSLFELNPTDPYALL